MAFEAIRVKKHSDHKYETWFRLFLDGELSCSFPVEDEVADEIEYRLLGMGYAARIEALEAALRPFAVRAEGWRDLIAKFNDSQLQSATATITVQMSDLAAVLATLREPGAGKEKGQ